MKLAIFSLVSNRKSFGRFLRFGFVGGSGVLVDMCVLFFLADQRMLGWDISLSKALAAETAIVNNFIWNDIWTFRDLSSQRTGWSARMRRFFKFNVICFAGIVFNIMLLNVQVRSLRMNIYAANLVAIFLVSIWNFWMNLKFGWSEGKKRSRNA